MMPEKKKDSTTATLVGTIIILLLLLLIIIALIILLRGGEPTPQESPLPAESVELLPEPTATPTPTPKPTPTPSPSPSEEPSPSPSEKPEETEKPTESPEASAKPSPTNVPPPQVGPVNDVLSHGSFASDTGTSLNTQVSWQAVLNGDGTVTIEVRLLLGSCRLNMMPQNSGAVIKIGDESFSCYTPAIEKEDNELALTWLSSQSITLPYTAGMSVPISTSFHYGGTYSGVEIGEITAEGTAVLS